MSDSIRSHNERLHPDLLKAELSDGSFFNANIHPPLLFQECSLSDEHRHYPQKDRFRYTSYLFAISKAKTFCPYFIGSRKYLLMTFVWNPFTTAPISIS
ncbi:hypothetical protein KUH03_31170 [Sphingobacterium sp. E70]|uniref:hypothetical protein n=1 Tax=Sphingobacterium sp. E70 TaxID=2853439 RepID=UPI00211C498A|nr:hypothetical protein [Sphingobacterium sp. E70]ULT23597.1 hypothetical protein KUH03_31170 [Sphingobacterium sp. E70]